MGLIKTILIIMLVYYVLKIVARMAFPHIMKKAMEKMESKMREQQGKNQQNVKVGETIIDKKPNTKSSNNSVGEYVDFEEVD